MSWTLTIANTFILLTNMLFYSKSKINWNSWISKLVVDKSIGWDNHNIVTMYTYTYLQAYIFVMYWTGPNTCYKKCFKVNRMWLKGHILPYYQYSYLSRCVLWSPRQYNCSLHKKLTVFVHEQFMINSLDINRTSLVGLASFTRVPQSWV